MTSIQRLDNAAMQDVQTLHEVIKSARAVLDDGAWDYLVGGTETETTLRRNRLALDSLALRPRVLNDVREVDAGTELLGYRLRMPVILAPLGSLQALHESGALGAARAAQSFGTLSMLSSVTQPGLERVASETHHPKIYQVYIRGDRNWVTEQVKTATDNGCVGFCLTVDTAVYSGRERDKIKRFTPAARRGGVTGMEYQAALSWDFVKWFKDSFDIPLVLKGIAGAADAGLAVEHGVDVVHVSNHGGRQLDHGLGAIEILPEVVAEVGGKATVIVDSGFLRGTDIVKAIALGADAVAVGKLYAFGLAAGGEAGVTRVLEILESEVKSAMALLGVTRLSALDNTYIANAQPVSQGAIASAFQLLDLPAVAY